MSLPNNVACEPARRVMVYCAQPGSSKPSLGVPKPLAPNTS